MDSLERHPRLSTPIACDLLLSITGPPVAGEDDVSSLEEKLFAWKKLPRWYHNDQLNMCRLYGQVDDAFLIEGLRLYEMKFEHAQAVGGEIRRVSLDEECMLSTAYSRLLTEPICADKAPQTPLPLRHSSESDEDMSAEHKWSTEVPLPCESSD